MVVFGASSQLWGQDKKDQKLPAKKGSVVTTTDKAPSNWLIKDAKVGVKMISDRDYILSALPKEMIGSKFVMRTTGDHGNWLPDAVLTAQKDSIVYAMIRVKYLGKETFDEVSQNQLEKDGWKEVEGKAATTFPAAEKWEWKVYKTDIKEGDVILQLSNTSWNRNSSAVLFFFK